MSEYEIRSVGGHVEVYTRGGVFLFSADTVREAMEELDEAHDIFPAVPGNMSGACGESSNVKYL